MKCALCGFDFDAKGMWAHKRKKQSCVSQKKVMYIYEQLHNLINKYDNNIDITTNIENIKDAVDDVEINPVYLNLRKFGHENQKPIDDSQSDIELSGKNSFLKYIKLLYCNPNYVENQTIKITSMQGIYCRTYRDGRWVLECYDKIMLQLVKHFFDMFKSSDNEKLEEYLVFIYRVVKQEEKDVRAFLRYTKKHILPEIYNISKRDELYLVHKKDIEKR